MPRLITYLLLLWVPFLMQAQHFPVKSWETRFDQGLNEIPQKLLKTPDGNLLLAGNAYALSPRNRQAPCHHIWIIKVDTSGQELWQKNIKLENCEQLRDIVNTSDGGFLFTGVGSSLIRHIERGDSAYWGDFIVGKLDAKGKLLWIKNYGGSNLDQANALVSGSQYDFYVTGNTHSFDGVVNNSMGMGDVWLLHVDQYGTLIRSKVYGGSHNDWANDLIHTQDGNFVIAGFTNSPQTRSQSPNLYGKGLLVKVNPYGKLLWEQQFSLPTGGTHLHAIASLPDQRLLVAGTQSTRFDDYWYAILDPTGKVQQRASHTSDESEQLSSLVIAQDGGFLLGGTKNYLSREKRKQQSDAWLIRHDANGYVRWQQAFGAQDKADCRDVLAYSDRTFFMVGARNKRAAWPGAEHFDFWLVRVDEKPCQAIEAEIYVRAEKNKVQKGERVRFRARSKHGDRFLWNFGDGSSSEEKDPLKVYAYTGTYPVSLTVFANQQCKQVVSLPKGLQVK